MAWATPWTATTGQVVTATELNQVRDNLRYLKGLDGEVEVGNSIKSTGSNARIAWADKGNSTTWALSAINGIVYWYNDNAGVVTTVLTITDTKRLGIGTTPSNPLHIAGATDTPIRVDGTNINSNLSTQAGSPPGSYIGLNGAWMGQPSTFLKVSVNGTLRYIPCY